MEGRNGWAWEREREGKERDGYGKCRGALSRVNRRGESMRMKVSGEKRIDSIGCMD